MIAFNKTIAYTKSWKHILWIAVLVGAILPLLLILLEPFDTSNEFSYKHLRLSGYAACIVLPILVVHPLENYVYIRQANRWFVINEFLYILFTLFSIFVCCFFYHFYVVSGSSILNTSYIWGFIGTFGLPFTPLIVPLWLYLRSKYGIIEVPLQDKKNVIVEKSIMIQGESKSEILTIFESDFIYAQSQQNYVEVYYLTKDGVQQKMFRSTLSNIIKQLPNAWQVHRSYLVNLDYLTAVEGNARKRFMKISNIEDSIPISQKYYAALSKRLSNSSQDLQD
eukprot:TRINITY_DN3049_c0_g1_i3.p1 TRINITY_DN3049_c0_g1~~TRINITY_DN3049_c0_g1_i3.p1  ORF type:complete len:280 (-),score=23.70 TRINITY_DN3049_c0_g1_i3:434-1273(-)